MTYRTFTAQTPEQLQKELDRFSESGYTARHIQFCVGQWHCVMERPYGADELSLALLKALDEVRRFGDSQESRERVKVLISPLMKAGRTNGAKELVKA